MTSTSDLFAGFSGKGAAPSVASNPAQAGVMIAS